MSCGKFRWLASSTQRSNAALKTAIPTSAARLAAGPLTPRRRNASASAEASDASLINSRSRSSVLAAMTAWRCRALSRRSSSRSNRWPAVHRLDSAHLFRLALEKAPAGSTLHGVADEGVAIRDIAEVIGRHLDLPVVSISPEDASEHYSWLAGFLAADSPASSALTRELLGWQPARPGLIDDLEEGHYFDKPSASGREQVESRQRS